MMVVLAADAQTAGRSRSVQLVPARYEAVLNTAPVGQTLLHNHSNRSIVNRPGDLDVDYRLHSDGFKTAKGGAFVKYSNGGFGLSVGGSYGTNWYDNNKRYLSYPTIDQNSGLSDPLQIVELYATGESTLASLSAKARASYKQQLGAAYIKPFVDLNLNHLKF